MTDWTTCRVVQDKDGDLWTNYAGMWHTPEMAPFSADILAKYDPTPVLDADGLPAVRTVGDLGNVHLGRRIKYEGPGGYGREGIYQGTTGDYPERDRCDMHVGGGHEAGVHLDTPCEVLDLGEEVEQPAELLAQVRDTIKRGWAKCPLCQGSIRQTVGLTCELCGRYHGKDGEWQ